MTFDIAILGSGISGLSSAWYLGNQHRVTLFEKENALGMGHKRSKITTPHGEINLDMPPRVTNKLHYPSFFELLEEADLDTYVVKQEASFSSETGDTYLAFKTFNSHLFSLSLPKGNMSSALWLGRHGKDLVRFYYHLWVRGIDQKATRQSLAPYLKNQGFHSDFIYGFLYPIWALMCTCSYSEIDRFPAADMLTLFKNFTSKAKSRRLRGGTEAFEQKLRQRIHKLHLGDAVLQVEKQRNKIKVKTKKGEAVFDHVIFATEPFTVGQILKGFESDQHAISCVPYSDTQMVLHTDTNLMPREKSNWAPVNLIWDQAKRQSYATLWMNKLEENGTWTKPIFQSWNPIIPPKEDCLLATRTFKRTLVTSKSAKAIVALRRMMKNDPDRRIWYVGSYATSGIPLLENGVKSAQLVTKLLNNKPQKSRSEPMRRYKKKGDRPKESLI